MQYLNTKKNRILLETLILKSLKSITLEILLLATISSTSQNIFTENFENINTLTSNGWIISDQTIPQPEIDIDSWFQGETDAFNAFQGTPTSYIGADAKSISQGDISNWLISPNVNLKNGDIISFYTRDADDSSADRLELRVSQLGSSSVIPTGGYWKFQFTGNFS
jgi:hypothetical protein